MSDPSANPDALYTEFDNGIRDMVLSDDMLRRARIRLERLNAGAATTRSRELSLAIAKIEEAAHWLVPAHAFLARRRQEEWDREKEEWSPKDHPPGGHAPEDYPLREEAEGQDA